MQTLKSTVSFDFISNVSEVQFCVCYCWTHTHTHTHTHSESWTQPDRGPVRQALDTDVTDWAGSGAGGAVTGFKGGPVTSLEVYSVTLWCHAVMSRSHWRRSSSYTISVTPTGCQRIIIYLNHPSGRATVLNRIQIFSQLRLQPGDRRIYILTELEPCWSRTKTGQHAINTINEWFRWCWWWTRTSQRCMCVSNWTYWITFEPHED